MYLKENKIIQARKVVRGLTSTTTPALLLPVALLATFAKHPSFHELGGKTRPCSLTTPFNHSDQAPMSLLKALAP